MILVTTGSNGAPFDRLLRVIEEITTKEHIVVQHGPSVIRPRGATCVAFMPFNRLNDLIERASTVITHGGAGSVLLALMHRKRPIVVPRLPQFGEVVDAHQLEFVRHLAEADLVILAEDPGELPGILARSPSVRHAVDSQESGLITDLSDYLHSVLRAAPNGADTRDDERSLKP